MNLDLVSDDESAGIEGLVPHHPEILAVQFAVGSESGSRISPRVLRDAVQCAGEGHFFGHAVEREIADDFVGLSFFLGGFHCVGDRRKPFDVQEVGIAQMSIAFLVVRIDRLCLDSCFDGFEGFRVCVHFDESVIVRKAPRGLRDHHVRHAKLDQRVIRIDVPSSRLGLDIQRAQHQEAHHDNALRPGSSRIHLVTFPLRTIGHYYKDTSLSAELMPCLVSYPAPEGGAMCFFH